MVEVPQASSVAKFHLVMQAAFGWEEDHLYEFEVDGQRHGLPQPGWGDLQTANDPKLGVLPERGVSDLFYFCEMGGSWERRIAIEAIGRAAPDSVHPASSPARAVGRPKHWRYSDYENLLEAIADPSPDEHDDLTG